MNVNLVELRRQMASNNNVYRVRICEDVLHSRIFFMICS